MELFPVLLAPNSSVIGASGIVAVVLIPLKPPSVREVNFMMLPCKG